MTDSVSTAALRARTDGLARTGTVNVRSFDEGVVETLGAEIIGDHYFITELFQHDAPPGYPGIPVVFSHPEDMFQTHRLPVIEVRRDDISPAVNRWHPGAEQYRTPSYGARPIDSTSTHFSSVEVQQTAVPFDILYTINIMARMREYMAAANAILLYVLRIYQPYCLVRVKDSVGDYRTYEAFMESVSPLDEVADVANRTIGFALSLRVEAELDLNGPLDHKTVSQPPIITLGRR